MGLTSCRSDEIRSPLRLGFTLTELLAAGTCVTLLTALVAPSLEAARQRTKQSVCLDRLRAIAAASLIYAEADPNGWSIPVHPQMFQQDPQDPIFVGAYEWGGKSGIGRGLPPMGGEPPSRYGTAAGFGPASRPLNNLLYPHGFRDNLHPLFDRIGAQRDSELQLDAFRCPADDGPPLAAHCPDWVANPTRTSFDHFGTSYAANVFMTSVQGGGELRSNSPYLRPVSRVPVPARTLEYEENIGRWAWACRRENSDCYWLGRGVNPGPTKSVRGWHGKPWTFNRAFVDAHAEAQPVYIVGTEDQEGYAMHYVSEHVPGLPGFECDGTGEGDYRTFQCILVRGPGWQKDTLPSPVICTGLFWGGVGRPSYENCVVGDEISAQRVPKPRGVR